MHAVGTTFSYVLLKKVSFYSQEFYLKQRSPAVSAKNNNALVTANSGKLPCTEVQLNMHHLLWAHIHHHWLETEPQCQSGLTDAAKVHLLDLHTILSNRMHTSYKAKVTPAMEYIPGQQNTPQVPALCQPPHQIHRTTFTTATAFSETGSSRTALVLLPQANCSQFPPVSDGPA
jgi:hypothetical protein